MPVREFSVWAPSAQSLLIELNGERLPMRKRADKEGWWHLPGITPRAGDRYAFLIDGQGPLLPDPRSLSQPDGVHGASEVIATEEFTHCEHWHGKDLRGAVLYELHVGTFTPEGTFDAAIAKLDHLVTLGVDAVEVMPVAAFPGERGWGYDGVDLFAVHSAYGGPHAFNRFITAAHEAGIAVVLDVVYNHLGPAGNYLGMFGPYFTSRHETPWGQAVNLDDEGSGEVRAFIRDNARQWLETFRLDGLRLDAVHELRDDSQRHILCDLAADAAQVSHPVTLFAESDQNQPITVTPLESGGMGMQAQWADDIHHALHVFFSGETSGYYADFAAAEALEKTLTRVFLHDGGFSSFRNQNWGAPVDPSSPYYDGHAFVASLQNHDQVGNRAAGDRIHHTISPLAQRAAAALYLLSPFTPMLFMGEEWACSSPFAFFTDHDAQLGPLVSAGRREEFARMGWGDEVPDPQSVQTALDSRLDWDELTAPKHADMFAWYRELISLRHRYGCFASGDLSQTSLQMLTERALVYRRGECTVVVNLELHPVSVPQLPAMRILVGADRGALFTGLAAPESVYVLCPQ
ncbi:malto-oligosyltrehalose trehalohydrolase [Dermabacteraceae bacterium P13264]